MIICWDNLEKIKYRRDIKKWESKKHQSIFYMYKDVCKNCGNPFLTKDNEGEFCSISCSNINRYYSIETKEKMSEIARKRFKLPENHPNYKGGIKNKNLPFYNTYAHQIDYCEQVRRNKQDTNILEVKCAYCGKWFIPTTTSVIGRIQALNGKGSGESRLYCSENCKQECPIYNQRLYPKGFKPATSREVQPELRQMCFERDNFTCQKCGKTETGLHCHHIEGIRWEPLESADLDKVIAFCKNCHIEVHKLPGCKYHELRCK